MRSSQSTPGCGGRGTPAAISRRSRQPSSACTWRSCAWIPPGRAASAGPTGGRPRSTPSTSPSTAACPQAGTRPYKISYTEDLTDANESNGRCSGEPGCTCSASESCSQPRPNRCRRHRIHHEIWARSHDLPTEPGEVYEFVAQVVGIVVVEVGEDVQGLLPGLACCPGICGGLVSFAAMGENGCL